ncbi:UNKNOWN [Stylonychia lemnae]|uniref:RING-type domain-containing protein n=1 Tax=Stylonychia lemnae TaxID=5949 RepID=A0A078AQ05_STYLE|nr:UNKNOWN [Stylonychia lemnae]|eukprot:CDW84249.1 UNKNOWN [Stylonychia lemnae]
MECFLCSSQFEENEQQQVMQPQCGHRICQQCLSQQQEKGINKCQLCGQESIITDEEGNPETLPTNVDSFSMIKRSQQLFNLFENRLTICCVPCNFKLDAFQKSFIQQLNHQPKEIIQNNQQNSIMHEQLITLVYDNEATKLEALSELNQKIYRQSSSHNQVMYIVKKEDKRLPLAFVQELNDYDLVMIQHKVPMLRNPNTNLIKIDNSPIGFGDRDCGFLERTLNLFNGVRNNESDLAVRSYQFYNQNFVIVYLGSCDKMAEIVQYLQKQTFFYTLRKIKADIVQKPDQSMNQLMFVNFHE